MSILRQVDFGLFAGKNKHNITEIRQLELRKKRKLILPLRASQPGLVSEILELAKLYEEKTTAERAEREKRQARFQNKPHLVDPSPPAVARLNRLKNLALEEKWSNIHLRRMIRFESMLIYDCLEPKERLEKFKEPIELTEVKPSQSDWILKTFKRKQASTGKLSRNDVTPIRIPIANKYAYLVGREENFDIAGFEETLTPVVDVGKRKRDDQDAAGTPQRKRTRKSIRRKKDGRTQVVNLSSTDMPDENLSKKRCKRKNQSATVQERSKNADSAGIFVFSSPRLRILPGKSEIGLISVPSRRL